MRAGEKRPTENTSPLSALLRYVLLIILRVNGGYTNHSVIYVLNYYFLMFY